MILIYKTHLRVQPCKHHRHSPAPGTHCGGHCWCQASFPRTGHPTPSCCVDHNSSQLPPVSRELPLPSFQPLSIRTDDSLINSLVSSWDQFCGVNHPQIWDELQLVGWGCSCCQGRPHSHLDPSCPSLLPHTLGPKGSPSRAPTQRLSQVEKCCLKVYNL